MHIFFNGTASWYLSAFLTWLLDLSELIRINQATERYNGRLWSRDCRAFLCRSRTHRVIHPVRGMDRRPNSNIQKRIRCLERPTYIR
ncbi:hypothetical protein GGR51DRAFT_524704 [Nemania sp. FL0031]|nr:hypothetical protein GGR51DRAFT_524704 [Nemania sp. FL0031]